MKHQTRTQIMYTKRTLLYNFFIHLVGYAQAIKKIFTQSDYLKPNMRIADAGCGTGLVTRILYRLAKNKKISIEFYGFDLTPAMLDQCKKWIKKNNVTNIILQQADVLKPEQLPANWNNFDLVLVSGMLEHLKRERITEGIVNLKKLLKPGGTLFISICKRNWLAHWLIKKWWKAEIYTTKEIKTIMHKAGFFQFTFKGMPFPYGYLNSWVHIIEAKKPHKIAQSVS